MPKQLSELTAKELTQTSRFLSLVLRHKAKNYGLEIEADGGVLLENLLNLPKFSEFAEPDKVVANIVDNDAKNRYTIFSKNNNWYIRANQGHSVKVSELPLKRVLDFSEIPVAIHGTYLEAWEKIQASGGLSKQKRQHIHLAAGLPEERNIKSGIRSNAQVYIYIDTKAAMRNGIEFFISENGVILTPGNSEGIISSEYFKNVDIRTAQLKI
ncbi:hypothetical protein BB561_005831 [Smittium simulii]|uniref:2'-phosphotransferase n=1 Tax=Smittium simulii TaxID=133385 RepID=A0A2T9Y837_9FUNG|nr:hypothetical protein BB561_005831 [Smittium simulii]